MYKIKKKNKSVRPELSIIIPIKDQIPFLAYLSIWKIFLGWSMYFKCIHITIYSNQLQDYMSYRNRCNLMANLRIVNKEDYIYYIHC